MRSTSPYTFCIDDELRQALERKAELEKRPTAQLAKKAPPTMLEAKAAKRAAMDSAHDEASCGSFISQDAMNRWIDSWGSEAELPMPDADIRRG